MTKKEKKDDQAPGKDDKPKPADGDQKGKAGTTPKASGKAGTANEAAGKESTNLKPGSVGAGSESGGGGSRGVLAVVLVACAVGLAAAGGYFFMLHGQDRAAVGGAARQERDKTPFPCKERYADDEIRSFVDRHLAGAKGGHKEPQLLLMLGGSGAGKGTFIEKWKSAEQRGQASGHPLSGFLFHGLDEYLPYIPEYQKSVNDKAFVYKDAADACYKPAAIPAAKLAGDRIVADRMDLIYEETGKSMDRIVKRVLPPFLKAGYRITTVLVHNKPEIAIGRAAGRFQKTGRYAPDDYIQGTFANNLETYMGLQKVDGLSEFVYCDNSAKQISCWRDRADGGALVPSSILLDGPPVTMGSKPAAKLAAKPAEKPAAKPAAKKPAAEPAEKPAAKKPAAKKPAEKPAAKKPAAKMPAEKPAAGKGRGPTVPPAGGKGRGGEL